MRGYVDMLLITSTANIKTWERDNGLYGGLSPLARGTLLCPGVLLALARFIPAGAGNTLPLSALLARNTVYPRWRGEHRSSHYFPFFFDGLSPLARGTRRQRIVRLPLHRFIPAGAGNTINRSRRIILPPVYPRWRGEHTITSVKAWSRIGLSPLARGTLTEVMVETQNFRFIPAGAGNTISVMLKDIAGSVYPRWRGEHWQNKHRGTRGAGLSPLARGTLDQAVLFFQRRRFIPAGAGNTPKEIASQLNLPVYPRWRGEHKIHIDKHRVCIGLS